MRAAHAQAARAARAERSAIGPSSRMGVCLRRCWLLVLWLSSLA